MAHYGSYLVRGQSPQFVNWAGALRIGGRYETPEYVGDQRAVSRGNVSAPGTTLADLGDDVSSSSWVRYAGYGAIIWIASRVLLAPRMPGRSGLLGLLGFNKKRRRRRRR